MPEISPFRPHRYNPSRISDPGRVIAPPYDVISPEGREELLASDPHNVIQLILPGGGDDRYRRAGETWSDWLADGTLVREETPAIFPYAQHFVHPVDGATRIRTGFIAVMKLSEFGEGHVLPHERTLSGPKVDRLNLMRTTTANLEPIFGMFSDLDGKASRALAAFSDTEKPILDVRDSDGVRHVLWRMRDASTRQRLTDVVRDVPVVIVDGHHRYETALLYRDETGGSGSSSSPAEQPADWIMIFLVPSSDPGLLILPTHRLLHGVTSFDFDRMLRDMGATFDLVECADYADGAVRLEESAPNVALLLLRHGRSVLATLRGDVDVSTIVSPGTPDELMGLDVTVLHDHVFESLLGIDRQAQEEQRNLKYVKGTSDAFSAADSDEVDMVAMMNPPRLEQVVSVAGSGRTMPQKSTYFYPKLASGLLFNSLA